MGRDQPEMPEACETGVYCSDGVSYSCAKAGRRCGVHFSALHSRAARQHDSHHGRLVQASAVQVTN